MSAVNVEKMRRQLARAGEAAVEADRLRWLASLTPEHRAVHEAALVRPVICWDCYTEEVAAAAVMDAANDRTAAVL